MTRIKTIIVDDENRIRRAIERQVRACGEEWEIIGSFSDGKEALRAITEEDMPFDLLVTDVRMPEMDGLTLISQLKKSHDFSSIIISGYDDFSYLQTAMRAGSLNYILKPVDRVQFRGQLEEVKEKILSKKAEKKQLKDKSEQLIYTRQIQLLSEATWSMEVDVPAIDWDAHFPDGYYSLICIGIDQFLTMTNDFPTEEWGHWQRKMETYSRQLYEGMLVDNYEKIWWWRTGKLNFWLLLYKQNNDYITTGNGLEVFASALKDTIQRKTPFTASLAVGPEFDKVERIPEIRDRLMSVLQHRIIQGGNHVFYADKENNYPVSQTKSIHPRIYKYVQKILSTMETESDEKTKQVLNELFHELEIADSPALIEEMVSFLYIRIIDRWMEFEGFTEGPKLLTEALQLTRHAGNFSQLKDGIKLWVLKVKKGIANFKQLDSDPVQRAKQWINNHLGDNITIKKIADHVYMSPTYFSNFFKAQTGETVLDYVTKCRLRKARELLVSTDHKVYDIASQLGYQDTKYFSRLFKQWQGQSPSQYRESHQHI
ncbi:helix-turn-helix domain-containing protein [Sediminibacillus massiliensis]|uniref:helix-turn-helix domain-containing protein n=1 Tax=Sediminibacillus massiliensis TaxID=1926277 RepID=UPI0009887233|nr:helix-turn-helix domain-containing protein [Sediminibacillus massiliensis]